ncbi:MAG TPA: S8 family serine peptidase, partial [Ilumatobacteraceae bacterium]|nr:S8 family serine peptidase [Ilumatobacteraceae bacterium]
DMRDAYKAAVTPPGGRFPELYNSARDYDGHGTHTATTAAGNAGVPATVFNVDRGPVSGIAPRARLIVYAACGAGGCATSDLVASIDQAVADGVDVINYSIGSPTPSLTGADELAFLFAADANVWVAASNGNEGPGAQTTGSPASVPWVTSVGASTQDRTFSATARLGNGQLAIGASITNGTGGAKPLVDAATLGNELCQARATGPTFSAPVTGKIVLCLRGGNARVDKSRVVAAAGGAGMILYNPNDVQALVTDSHWVPSVHVNFTTGRAIKAYIAAAPATARATLLAGKKVRSQGSVMADFSSRGPNGAAADIIKPDVTAPGVNILAGQTPTPWIGNDGPGAPGQLFQSISGTSMSSPHVAGLFALLRQEHPDWTAAMAKSAVMTTARQDVTKEDASTPADPFDMGAGHVDPAGPPSRAGSMFSPGLVYDAGLFDYYGFMCDAAPIIFLDPVSTCAGLEGGGYPTTAADLNLASIGVSSIVGTRTVQRTVTSVADATRTFVASVEAPAGFDVTVEPSSIRLAPGESETYTVTFTRVDAAYDEWSFGSLTWTSGGYEVRSPLAAQAQVLAAPDAVQGEGVEGSVTVPVRFGYTGEYTAGAHGPVPATRTPGTVTQDPDRTFVRTDPAGTTAVPITVSGSAFLRIALATADLSPPNPNTDIDLYLYDAAGDEVGSSGASSTNELIELAVPEDGTYTLYVHGWQ